MTSGSGDFDPRAYYVHVRPDPLPLRITFDWFRSYTAFVAPSALEDQATLEDAVATLEWTRVPIGQIENARMEPFLVIDDVDGDIFAAYAEMFDEDGSPRVGDIDFTLGRDFLYFREITVRPPFDFVRVGAEVIEHVLDEFGGGCFGAVFMTSSEEALSLPLRRLLESRHFKKLGKEERLYLRQLAFSPPPLVEMPPRTS